VRWSPGFVDGAGTDIALQGVEAWDQARRESSSAQKEQRRDAMESAAMTDKHGRNEDSSMLHVWASGVDGLDRVLGGGLAAGRAYLIAGEPGTGKTTLGNQLVFNHAATGQTAVFASFLTETYDSMLTNMRGFTFLDSSLIGTRVKFYSLMSGFAEGLEVMLSTIRGIIRDSGATLLVIDGATVIQDSLPTSFELRRFTQHIQIYSALLGCTTILLTTHTRDELRSIGAHVDGIILLTNERIESLHSRVIEVLKVRGLLQISGAHEFSMSSTGITVHPRLESIAGQHLPPEAAAIGLGTGIPGLDAMLGGGLIPYSSTLLIGTPGAGKTLLGLSFLTEGGDRGERGLIAGFHESAQEIAATASRIGLDLRRHIDSGMVHVMWTSPTELSVDEWAWRLFAMIDIHRPQRVFIDSLSDIQRLISRPQRLSAYVAALVNELRARGTTIFIATEIDSYVDQELIMPIPAALATMDNGILVRQIELNARLNRLITVLKARQAATDPVIREFIITDQGIDVSRPFLASGGPLTGRAEQANDDEAGSAT